MSKVSVIMPVYNGERYLRKCIESVLNQTLKDIELICINDCSIDSSYSILQEYAQNDSRLKIINSEENLGQSISRNLGINSAKSPYIMFIDQDDWYELEACEKAYNQILQNKNDFVIFKLRYQSADGSRNYIDNDRILPFQDVKNCADIKPYKLATNIFVASYVWCEIFDKEFLDKNDIRFSVEKQADDVPFFVKAMVYAESISIIDEPLYNYRIYDSSTTTSRTDLWESMFTAREKAYEIVLNSPHANELMPAFLAYDISTLMYWYKHFTVSNKKIKKSFYLRMRSFFISLQEKEPEVIKKLKTRIKYKKFQNVINDSWRKHFWKEIFTYLFYTKSNKFYKDYYFLGFRFRFSKRLKG